MGLETDGTVENYSITKREERRGKASLSLKLKEYFEWIMAKGGARGQPKGRANHQTQRLQTPSKCQFPSRKNYINSSLFPFHFLTISIPELALHFKCANFQS